MSPNQYCLHQCTCDALTTGPLPSLVSVILKWFMELCWQRDSHKKWILKVTHGCSVFVLFFLNVCWFWCGDKLIEASPNEIDIFLIILENKLFD